MTENEAIERIKTGICCEKGTVRYCTDACMYGKEKCAYSVAIKALKEIQQYRELEKRLTGMFSGELSLETVVDELERQLKEPNNPHPINAKILTYEDAAAWDAYHAIGTPEECQAAVEKQTAKRPVLKNGESGMFVDYTDGHGEYKVAKWQDWVCPVCGWFVGQRYNAHRNGSKPHPHDQRKSKYCNECGQKLDWNTDTVADQEDTEARR